MRAKAVREYKDKYTKESVKTGSIVELEEERLKEINSTKYGKFLEVIEEPEPEPEPKEEPKKQVKKEKPKK